jgi:hypothetical protein
MKTKVEKPNLLKKVSTVAIALILVSLSVSVSAQESESKQTMFQSDVRVSELWVPEVKLNSIQGDIGSLIGFYGGALFNDEFLLGITGGVNLTHPRVNYGYFGVIGQYIYEPSSLVHFSGQLVLASGTTKDYESAKSSLFDNFWNISGAQYYQIEPGVNLEVNLSRRMTFVAGVSYRYVTGLDEADENVQITHVTNKDLGGINFNVGLKFGKKKKSE